MRVHMRVRVRVSLFKASFLSQKSCCQTPSQDGCQTEMSRSVRMALWDYRPNAALTVACDDAVVQFCPKVCYYSFALRQECTKYLLSVSLAQLLLACLKKWQIRQLVPMPDTHTHTRRKRPPNQGPPSLLELSDAAYQSRWWRASL